MPGKAEPRGARGGTRASDRAPLAEDRFRLVDAYRVEREWKRFEGTPQRTLLRTLRERVLARNAPGPGGPVLEVGPGPGRFTPRIATSDRPVVLLDLSRAMLERARGYLAEAVPESASLHFVQGNGRSAPFRRGSFSGAILLGNVLGFASEFAEEMLDRTAELVGPGGTLLLEIAPTYGEYSRYLHRLPSTVLSRLFQAPLGAILPRVLREGFEKLKPLKLGGHRFRRLGVEEVTRMLRGLKFEISETVSIAPCLGADPEKLNRLEAADAAWGRVLELEEAVGHLSERWQEAASLVIAARRTDGEVAPRIPPTSTAEMVRSSPRDESLPRGTRSRSDRAISGIK